MAHSNGYIIAPIEDADVAAYCWVQLQRTVSGTVQTIYSYDVGCLCGASVGDTIPAFDSLGSWTVVDRGEINRWARFKPVRYALEQELTHSQRFSVYFGLDPKFVTNAGALLNDDVYGLLQMPSYAYPGWGHMKPSGGANTPYRLNDFLAKANDATTAPWVSSLAGYNHNAPFPCVVSIDQDSQAVRGYVVNTGADTYEVNIQVVSAVKFYFTPATGQDLCLQDFLDWNLQTTTMKWRPVLQMFYPDGTTPWYQRDRPTASAGGTEITYTRSTVLEVSVSTSGRNLNQYYYVCLGIGCCDSAGSTFPSGEAAQAKRLFIAPFQRGVRFNPQFYYRLRFVNYFTHAIKVVEVWYSDGSTFKQCTNSGGSQSFIAGNDIVTGGYLGVKIEITRTNIDAYFVEANTTLSVTPKMYIRASEQIGSGSETQRNLEPKTSNYVTNPNPKYWKIDADSDYAIRSPKLTTIAYAILPHGLTPTTTNTASYHMQSQMESQGWVDVNTFSVRVSQSYY